MVLQLWPRRALSQSSQRRQQGDGGFRAVCQGLTDYALRARPAGRSAAGRRNALAGTVTISQLRPGGDLDENCRATISTPPDTSTLQAARNWLFTRQSHQRTTSSAPTRRRQRLSLASATNCMSVTSKKLGTRTETTETTETRHMT